MWRAAAAGELVASPEGNNHVSQWQSLRHLGQFGGVKNTVVFPLPQFDGCVFLGWFTFCCLGSFCLFFLKTKGYHIVPC